VSAPKNPPAFPVSDVRSPDGCGLREGSPGMGLREYFAIHAPEPREDSIANEQGIDRGRNPHNDAHKPKIRSRDEIVATLRFRFADAMLALSQERDTHE
jgi:hypothetical protein